MELEEQGPALFDELEIAPGDASTPAGANRLHAGFLDCEAQREMWTRSSPTLAGRALARCEQALPHPLPPPVQSPLDSGDFHDVDPRTDDHARQTSRRVEGLQSPRGALGVLSSGDSVGGPMATRVGINGFGRIGRCVLRSALGGDGSTDLEFVAVNDLTDPKTLAHLLKYDSVHGRFGQDVSVDGDSIRIGSGSLKVLAERDPAALPWGDLGVDIVIESTGIFTKRPDASKHLSAGAKKVIISAPATDPDATIALGVNEEIYDPASHHIVSNASCTTNCLAPVAKVIDQTLGLKRGWMTTTHAFTNDQRMLDLPHSDLRRARAASASMIPTSTGAARAVGLVLPQLQGKLDGIAIRGPTTDVSVVDLVCEVESSSTGGELNEAFRKAAAGGMKGILDVCDEPLVSIDFLGNPHSSIVDSQNTKVLDGSLVKVLSWYDNEWGYSNRVVDLAGLVAKSL